MPIKYLNNPLSAETPIITVIACSAPESGEMGPRFSILTRGEEGWKDEIPLAYLPRFLNLTTHPQRRLISTPVEEGITSVFANELAKTDGKYHFTDKIPIEVATIAAKHPAPSEDEETYCFYRVNKFCDFVQSMTAKRPRGVSQSDGVQQQQQVYTAIHQLFAGLNEHVPVVDRELFHAVLVSKYEEGFDTFLRDLKAQLPPLHPLQKKQFKETLADFLKIVPAVNYGDYVDITTKNGFIITHPSEVRRGDTQGASLMNEAFTPGNVVLMDPAKIGFGTTIPAAEFIPEVETAKEKRRRLMPTATPDVMDVDTSYLQRIGGFVASGIRSMVGLEKTTASEMEVDTTHVQQTRHSMAVDDETDHKNTSFQPIPKRQTISFTNAHDSTYVARDLSKFIALYASGAYKGELAVYRVPIGEMRAFTRMMGENPAKMMALMGAHSLAAIQGTSIHSSQRY